MANTEGNSDLVCLDTPVTEVIVSTDNGNKYVFNGDSTYDPDVRYLLYDGVYIFANIPEAHPMAILNNGKKHLISYTGSNKAGTTECKEGDYDFYSGNIRVTVYGDFGRVSIYCLNHGYMGGKNLLMYSPSCNPDPTPEPTPHISCCPKPGLIDKKIVINADGKKNIKPKNNNKSTKMRKANILKSRIK